MSTAYENVSCFIFDLDGCIYAGDDLYDGAKECIALLQLKNKRVLFLTNNSADSAAYISEKLNTMGIPSVPTDIITALDLVGFYLYNRYGFIRAAVVGTVALEESLAKCGHQVVALGTQADCDFVVVGLDSQFNYEKIFQSVQHLQRGAKLIAANMDFNRPGQNFKVFPETGSLYYAIKKAANIQKIEYAGKPNPFAFQYITDTFNLLPIQCMMIGDNPYTDIVGAQEVGFKTVWLSHQQMYPVELIENPDVIMKDISVLYDQLNQFYGERL